MIVVIRNPIDVFPSFSSLFNCCSHSLVPKESYQDLEFWKEWVPFATKGLKNNHKQVIRVSELIPTFYLRFEDMRTDPVSTLIDCFKFILDAPSIEGTVVEKRIKEKCALNT